MKPKIRIPKRKIKAFLRNKYYVMSLFFVVWILFFDEYSIVNHFQNKSHLREMKGQKEYYKKQINSDRQKLEEINAEQKDLEKFAREHFLLSKSDEDIYIIVEK